MLDTTTLLLPTAMAAAAIAAHAAGAASYRAPSHPVIPVALGIIVMLCAGVAMVGTHLAHPSILTLIGLIPAGVGLYIAIVFRPIVRLPLPALELPGARRALTDFSTYVGRAVLVDELEGFRDGRSETINLLQAIRVRIEPTDLRRLTHTTLNDTIVDPEWSVRILHPHLNGVTQPFIYGPSYYLDGSPESEANTAPTPATSAWDRVSAALRRLQPSTARQIFVCRTLAHIAAGAIPAPGAAPTVATGTARTS